MGNLPKRYGTTSEIVHLGLRHTPDTIGQEDHDGGPNCSRDKLD